MALFGPNERPPKPTALRSQRHVRPTRRVEIPLKGRPTAPPKGRLLQVSRSVSVRAVALVALPRLQDFIRDEAQDLHLRQWMWLRYGTAYRATYTMHHGIGLSGSSRT